MLFLSGRYKNLIILPNGENVSPEYLESKLRTIELIDEVLVYASKYSINAKVYCERLKDEKNNICLKNAILSEIDRINVTLPEYTRIRNTEFISNPLKKNNVGKVLRNYKEFVKEE